MKFPTENPRKPGNWKPAPGGYIHIYNACSVFALPAIHLSTAS